MKNYESPTIELAGGSGNTLEPQTVLLILLVGIVLAAYIAAGVFTTAAETIVAVHLFVFVRSNVKGEL